MALTKARRRRHDFPSNFALQTCRPNKSTFSGVLRFRMLLTGYFFSKWQGPWRRPKQASKRQLGEGFGGDG